MENGNHQIAASKRRIWKESFVYWWGSRWKGGSFIEGKWDNLRNQGKLHQYQEKWWYPFRIKNKKISLRVEEEDWRGINNQKRKRNSWANKAGRIAKKKRAIINEKTIIIKKKEIGGTEKVSYGGRITEKKRGIEAKTWTRRGRKEVKRTINSEKAVIKAKEGRRNTAEGIIAKKERIGGKKAVIGGSSERGRAKKTGRVVRKKEVKGKKGAVIVVGTTIGGKKITINARIAKKKGGRRAKGNGGGKKTKRIIAETRGVKKIKRNSWERVTREIGGREIGKRIRGTIKRRRETTKVSWGRKANWYWGRWK